MQEITQEVLDTLEGLTTIGYKEDGTVLHFIYVKTPTGVKMFNRDPTLYPDSDRLPKTAQSISFQYSDEAKRYKYLQDIGTVLRTYHFECKNKIEEEIMVLSENPHIAHTMLEYLDAQIKYLRDCNVVYKQSKAKCITGDEKTLLLLNSQRLNLKNKIARCLTEIPMERVYPHMQPYDSLKVLNRSLFFEGTRLSNYFGRMPKYTSDFELIYCKLTAPARGVFDSVLLRLKDKLDTASIHERQLFSHLNDWSLNVRDEYVAPIRLPKMFKPDKIMKTYTYWCCNVKVDVPSSDPIQDVASPTCTECGNLIEYEDLTVQQ